MYNQMMGNVNQYEEVGVNLSLESSSDGMDTSQDISGEISIVDEQSKNDIEVVYEESAEFHSRQDDSRIMILDDNMDLANANLMK